MVGMLVAASGGIAVGLVVGKLMVFITESVEDKNTHAR